MVFSPIGILMYWFYILLSIFSFLYFWKRNRLYGYSIPLDHSAKPDFIKVTGKKVKLTHGDVYYTLSGPSDGELVVFVHGINTPSWVFHQYQTYFTNNGYKVLSFDLYGRGFSSSPDVTYNDQLFTTQLYELLTFLDLKKVPFNLCGYSLGGAISTIFTTQHPELVKKLVLLAPAGVLKLGLKENIGLLITKIPLIPEFIYQQFAKGSFLKKAHIHFEKDDLQLIENSKKGMTFQYDNNPGYALAILNTMKNFPLTSLKNTYSKLTSLKKQVCIIWGDKDILVPFDNSKTILEVVPDAKLVVIQGKGHQVPLQEVEKCTKEIHSFLKI